MLKIGGGHKLRKALFMRGIRQGFLNVEEVEEALPPGLLTAAEKWLLYFSLRASHVELRDASGRIVTPDEIVPEHRAFQRYSPREDQEEQQEYAEQESGDTVEADHLA